MLLKFICSSLRAAWTSCRRKTQTAAPRGTHRRLAALDVALMILPEWPGKTGNRGHRVPRRRPSRTTAQRIPLVHLLIVEDDPRLGRLLQRLLAEERHLVELTASGD